MLLLVIFYVFLYDLGDLLGGLLEHGKCELMLEDLIGLAE